MFKHRKFKQMLSAYVDGELSEKEKQIVQAHLKSCSSCQKELDTLKKVSSLSGQWSDEAISPDLEQKIRNSYLGGKYKEVAKMKRRQKIFVGVSSVALTTLLIVGIFYTQSYIKQSLQDRFTDTANEVVSAKEETPYQWEGTQLAKTTAKQCSERTFIEEYENQGAPFISYDGSVSDNYAASSINGGPRSKSGSFSSMAFRVAESPEAEMWSQPEPGYVWEKDEFNTEGYDRIYENRFLKVVDNPLSTFSIDVDTASYANLRRFINSGQLPYKDAVRIEEMINYFNYDYPQPKGDVPFSITTEVAQCPWNNSHDIVLIGLQGKEISREETSASNLTFLIDVSGSMSSANKLPLLRNAFKLLVNELKDEDRVSIVVYAGAAGLVLDSTAGSNKQKILDAIDRLSAGGSTAGGAGIKLAYKIAEENFIKDGNNRVILATDGDFNVGASSDSEMVRLIEEKRDKGIFLTVLGFGQGNYKDSKMEKIADKGNGNYFYIDNILEAKKVLVKELGATLFTIAKDVKIQIEFNPAKIKAYRLIGYENRMLRKEDFNDDTKDAGELGAGHTVTALYEVIAADSKEEVASVDELKYQEVTVKPSNELMTVKLRYKEPDGTKSKLITQMLTESARKKVPTENLNFANAVAEFGLLLRDSEHKANASYEDVISRAKQSKGDDPNGYRAEFIRLVESAQLMGSR